MKKAKKMAEGGISGLGGLLGSLGSVNPTYGGVGVGGVGVGVGGGGGGGGGSAMEGLTTVNKGATDIGSALSRASEAIGGGGSSGGPQYTYKKGGYVDKNGKLNLGSGRVSTASKNKSSKNW